MAGSLLERVTFKGLFPEKMEFPGKNYTVRTQRNANTWPESLRVLKFLCRFRSRSVERIDLFRYRRSSEDTVEEEYDYTLHRCGPSDLEGASSWLAAFKEERAQACDSESPELSGTLPDWLKPRCLLEDSRERLWIRDGTMPLALRYRRFGQQNVDSARSWLNQAREARASLGPRKGDFEAAVLVAGGDPRIPALMQVFAERIR